MSLTTLITLLIAINHLFNIYPQKKKKNILTKFFEENSNPRKNNKNFVGSMRKCVP